MKRDRLYTVNKWNRQGLSGNLFYGLGSQPNFLTTQPLQMNLPTANYNNPLNGMSAPLVTSWTNDAQRNSALGWMKSQTDSLGTKGASGLNLGDIGKAAAPAIGAAVGSLGNSLISNGLSSGAGSAISNIGGTLGSAIGSVNPIAGAIVSAGSGIIGGLTNAAFGMAIDQEALNRANEGTSYLNNFTSNAQTFDTLTGPQAQAGIGNVYRGGWFTGGKAARKNEELRQKRALAQQFAENSVENNLNNLVGAQNNTLLANYIANGGHLKRTGYSPRVNRLFDNGGLMLNFMDSFQSDPVAAAVNYSKQLDALDAQREAEEEAAQREAALHTMQQQIAGLQTQNQGLQAMMAAIPTTQMPVPAWNPAPVDEGVSQAASDYNNLKDFLKFNEGFLKSATPDGKYPSIGYGFNYKYPGTDRLVQKGDTITKEDAEKYLDIAIRERADELSKIIPTWGKLQPYQQDALIDLAYNAGAGARHFRKNSKLMTALANEDYEEAAKHLATTSKIPGTQEGLRKRSARRKDLFMNGYNVKAFGGELGTNGTDFTNGLLQVNEGGSHESNPLEGVPMGLDENGVPNLVEEGETVYNDYVFSQRMKVPESLYEDLGLKGAKKDLSFADASKSLAKESEQRPNDPLSKAGLDASLAKLAQVQEAERMKQEAQEESMGLQQYAYGGKKGNIFEGNNRSNRKYTPGADLSLYQRGISGEFPEGWVDAGYNSDEWSLLDLINPIGLVDAAIDDYRIRGIMDRENVDYNEARRRYQLERANYNEGIAPIAGRGGVGYRNYRPAQNTSKYAQALNSAKNAAKSRATYTPSRTTSSINRNTGRNFVSEANNTADARLLEQGRQWGSNGPSTYRNVGKTEQPTVLNQRVNGVESRGVAPDAYVEGSLEWNPSLWRTISNNKYFYPSVMAGTAVASTPLLYQAAKQIVSTVNGNNGTQTVTANGSQSTPSGWRPGMQLPNDSTSVSPSSGTPNGIPTGSSRSPRNTSSNNPVAPTTTGNPAARTPAIDPLTEAINNANRDYWDNPLLDVSPDEIAREITTPNNFQYPDEMLGIEVDRPGTTTINGSTGNGGAGGSIDGNTENYDIQPYDTWMRYAPVFGAGALALTDALGLTNKPDYTYADKLEAAAERAGYTPNISFNPIGNYLRYNPMDIWYEQNRLDANARATDRAILNNTSPSRMAGLLASGYNSQLANGNLYRQALEYNDAQRQKAAEFNRGTDMFNSQMGLEADIANARNTQMARQFGLSGLAQAAALRDSIDQRVGASRAANISNLLTSLGNIGRENMAFNMINSTNAARNGYWIGRDGVVHHTKKNV